MTVKVRKKNTLRFNEYYNTQEVQDELYRLSSQKFVFKNLMNFITQDENILLAYRSIKKNKGSRTAGTNKKTILDVASENPMELIQYVKTRLKNYQPHAIKRVEIPKPNGKTRPLGIPTIEDRLIQQCIKQVLEPILEAKFYKHSYGFRPERSTHHAIAIFQQWTYSGFQYVVDIDIKGFFDNVNHGKLLKQLWSLGIRDKTLLSILSRMLKAEVKGIGKSNKGTPQGGILSPLLANVVLNELDWWIDSQWDSFPTKTQFKHHRSKILSQQKHFNLKEIKIVRYADDFKIMCKDFRTAQKIFVATKSWLKERLHLEVSPEKSKITNLRRNYSEFLGFKLKVKKGKAGKYTNRSCMCDKAKTNAIDKLKKQIKTFAKEPTVSNVNKYNSIVLGLQNYYKIATLVNLDFIKIAYITNKSLDCRTKRMCQRNGTVSSTYQKFYKQYRWKKRFIANTILFPLAGIKWRMARMFPKDCNRYTKSGRMYIHQRLKMDKRMIHYLLENPSSNRSIEFNDNRISRFVAQQGKCYISGVELTKENMEVHHIKPLSLWDDLEQNLVHGQYDSPQELMTDISEMTEGLVAVTVDYYCPLKFQIAYPDSGDLEDAYGYMATEYADEISELVQQEQEKDLNDMAFYFDGSESAKAKLVSAIWDVESVNGELYGVIHTKLRSAFTPDEEREWIDELIGQAADGFGEGLEQREIPTEDGDLYVSFWHSGDDYFMENETDFHTRLQSQGFGEMKL